MNRFNEEIRLVIGEPCMRSTVPRATLLASQDMNFRDPAVARQCDV